MSFGRFFTSFCFQAAAAEINHLDRAFAGMFQQNVLIETQSSMAALGVFSFFLLPLVSNHNGRPDVYAGGPRSVRSGS
jgi:hypothetical protein